MKELGIYIHIPFCRQKCYYCDFISFLNKENDVEEYIEALKREIVYKVMELRNTNNRNNKQSIDGMKPIQDDIRISTIYIGGGTPSYIDSKYIREVLELILKEFQILNTDNIEVTIEINPGTITKQKLIEYKREGINRVSIGLQSANNILLKQIGRIHTYEEFLVTYKLAHEVGFDNINVDLMLGLPNQTMKMLEDSIQKIIALKPSPKHISIYSLIIEEGTKLCDMLNSNEIELPEQIERDMYWKVKKELERSGYVHYEISNFCKPGYESKHNVDCWNQKEYLGFGLASHSYYNNKRFSNTSNLQEYMRHIGKINLHDKVITINEIQTGEDKQKEYMLLGLRKIEGIQISEFKNKFVQNPIYVFKDQLNKLVGKKFIEIDHDNIKLTSKGLDFANIVWEEFV